MKKAVVYIIRVWLPEKELFNRIDFLNDLEDYRFEKNVPNQFIPNIGDNVTLQEILESTKIYPEKYYKKFPVDIFTYSQNENSYLEFQFEVKSRIIQKNNITIILGL